MLPERSLITVAVLAIIAASGPDDAAGEGGVGVPRTRAEAMIPDSDRLSPGATAIDRYVKRISPGELDWKQIPWLDDLSEAIGQAREEHRPLLIWATDDDPLERC